MKPAKRLIVLFLGGVVLPFAVTFSIVWLAWFFNREAADFTRAAWELLLWTPFFGTALGCGAVLLALKGWSRLAAIPYGFVMFWLQQFTMIYLKMMLPGNWL